MTAAASGASGDFAVSAAAALHRLTGDESWSAPVVAVLLGGDFWGVRLNAAMALAHFAPTIELIAAAMQGVPVEIINRQLVHFYRADPEYGIGVATKLGLPTEGLAAAAE